MALIVSPLLLAVVILIGDARGDADCSFYNLLASLNITDPPPDERPVTDWRNVSVVYLDFTLYTIIQLDMNQQTIITYIWFYMSWQNEFLSWNPDDFCGIDSLLVPSGYFWKPDLYITEMTEEDHSSPVISYYNLTNNGKISNSMPMRVVSTCNLDLFKFPFDKQTCRLTFRSYLYTVRDLVMVPKTNSYQVNKNSQEVYVSKGDWILVDITVQNITYDFLNDGFSQVIYEITLKRAPVIYIINLIIPACFLVFLDIASMFIQDYGERLVFKINVILGFSVLLLILNNILPHSNNTPMLGIFCAICIAMMVFSMLGTICSSYILEQTAEYPHVPQWLETTVLKYLASLLCFKKMLYTPKRNATGSMPKGSEVKPTTNVEVAKQKHDSENKRKDDVGVKVLKRLLLEVLKFHQELSLAKNEEESKSLWHKVACVIDRLILILYLLIVTIVFITAIVVWSM